MFRHKDSIYTFTVKKYLFSGGLHAPLNLYQKL